MGLLLPYQIGWIEDPSPVKVWEKSRRIGASWCDAADSALVAAKRREAGGMSTYYLAYNKDMTKQYVQDAAFWAGVYNLAASEMEEIVLRDGDRDVSIFQVRFDSGFVVQGLSSNPNNLRSKQGRVRIDEAAFVADLKALLKAALALIMWGGDVGILSTHNGVDNEFNQLVQDIRAGRLNYSLHRTTLDDALAQGLYRRICEVKRAKATTEAQRAALAWSPEAEAAWRGKMVADYGEAADEELFCIPSKATGTWLTRNIIEGCTRPDIPVVRWTPPAEDFVDWPVDQAAREVRDWCERELAPLLAPLPKGLHSWVGEDFGRSGDLTDIWPVVELPDASTHTPFVLELRNAPFRVQKQILYYVLDRLPNLSGVALDARGNGQYLAEVTRQDYGGPEVVHEVMLTPAWYREHMPRLKAALEDRTSDMPQDADVLTDFRGVKMVRGVASPPDGSYMGQTGQRHYDAVVAKAMALYAHAVIDFVPPWEPPVLSGGGLSGKLLRGF